MTLRLIFAFLLYILTIFNQNSTIDAACPGNPSGDGTITFYWKENKADRKSQMRNWGKLQETLKDDKYKTLTEYFDPKYVYAYTVTGECCWTIYNKTFTRGPSKNLSLGFGGIPNYPQFNVNSLKKVPC